MLLEIILGLSAFFTLIYWYMTLKFDYWTKKGVYQIKPSFPFGTFSSLFTLNKHINDEMKEAGEETKDMPYYGAYFLRSPIFMLKDPELVKTIMVKDFDAFVNRSSSNVQKIRDTNQMVDKIMMDQMTQAEGEKWKNIR